MIIIGILAAVAIPAFLSQRKNGWNTATRTDLANFGLAAESLAANQGGDFTQVFTTNTAGTALSTSGSLQSGNLVAGVDWVGSADVDLVLGVPATTTVYCVIGHNAGLGTADGWWVYSKARGGLQAPAYPSQALAAGRLLKRVQP